MFVKQIPMRLNITKQYSDTIINNNFISLLIKVIFLLNLVNFFFKEAIYSSPIYSHI